MIGRIRGILAEKQAPDILVDVQGICYELQVPMSTIYQLPAPGEGVVLHTHLVVREDAHLLFGFYSLQERQMFRSLIKVSGVGPKMALAILSGMAVDEFVRTIRINDIAGLTRMPGVGRKTAERLIVEMKDRLAEWGGDMVLSDEAVSVPAGASAQPLSQEAETALIALGYKPAEATRMIAQVLKANPELTRSEELIRQALRSKASS
ncbi:MAG: Holliday junction branch migration protein RuvA [Pseudomonadales bacterium]|nr:Holliday junction branch migration protein RuvA [Pseudomonadales bacterium]MCP5331396.1 Holliday junction branch migration protein RuvA [Pseudomonadales bacterium]MCP5344405.1 Holliday junction branch migration protein RuvA [Pseudomonadales bacterium]